ncbi:MAG: glutamate--tRNA ligase [Proteobacteria bacterium]|nr:glutamate--tRNA ligase [Pseudomonadota bacterium]
MTVVARFAPSPTGYLHIGGARTALFNWLFARHHGGTFRLRIEDTDRARSTEAAIKKIVDGLKWLELDWDGEVVMQFARAQRHAEVARALLTDGKAYRCYCTQEELAAMREKAKAEGRSARYDGTWRDRDPKEAPPGVAPTIRLRAPQEGETAVEDRVQGQVTVANDQLDDMVLLRSDGTPTYMLSVVVDDHDMGITHVIRGADHLNNAFRQLQLYRACGWHVPEFAHLPLILGLDGSKLSKRHGATALDAYGELGYLPEAMRNYLLRLGWSHGDEETISTEDAIRWFDLPSVGRSPARFDLAKLDSINGHYLRHAEDERLALLVEQRLTGGGRGLDEVRRQRLRRGMASLKQRWKTLNELADASAFYVSPRPLVLSQKAASLLIPEARALLARLATVLAAVTQWEEAELERVVRSFAETEGMKIGQAAQPLRAALTGSIASPSLFEVMAVLGREESLARLADVQQAAA